MGACALLALLPARLAVSQAHVETAVKSMRAGDCARARAEARRSLDFVKQRAVPQHIIAWCMLRDGRAPAAVRALDRALEQDPDNWVLLDATAVARATAGLDPRAAVRRAVVQNPQNALIREVAVAAASTSRDARARVARRLTIPLPELGDP